MIRPPGKDGVVFSERDDGDLRSDDVARSRLSGALGISDAWACVRQVHGSDVIRVDGPGEAGDADGVWSAVPGVPVAVFTADCFGVVLSADEAVGVAHAGWRGAASGVVANLRAEMTQGGHRPHRAAIGPGIGPCCFEVGPEVSARFEEAPAMTSWGSPSVDLVRAIEGQLVGLETWVADSCTFHEERWFSHRRDGTNKRLATVGWW